MKDHEIAGLVNELTQIARTYGQTQQLREHISNAVVSKLKKPVLTVCEHCLKIGGCEHIPSSKV